MSWQNDDFPDEEATNPKVGRRPTTGQSPQQPARQPDQSHTPGPKKHSFRPPPTGSQPVVDSAPQGEGPNTGGFPQQSGPNTGGYPQQPGQGGQGPSTGGFQGVPPANPTPTDGTPRTGFRSDTTGFQAVVGKRSQTPITPKVRVVYAGAGMGVGIILGLGLGVLNSLLEGISIVDGLTLTIQIAVWLGLIVGIVAAWRPRHFDRVFERLKSKFGGGG